MREGACVRNGLLRKASPLLEPEIVRTWGPAVLDPYEKEVRNRISLQFVCFFGRSRIGRRAELEDGLEGSRRKVCL